MNRLNCPLNPKALISGGGFIGRLPAGVVFFRPAPELADSDPLSSGPEGTRVGAEGLMQNAGGENQVCLNQK